VLVRHQPSGHGHAFSVLSQNTFINILFPIFSSRSSALCYNNLEGILSGRDVAVSVARLLNGSSIKLCGEFAVGVTEVTLNSRRYPVKESWKEHCLRGCSGRKSEINIDIPRTRTCCFRCTSSSQWGPRAAHTSQPPCGLNCSAYVRLMMFGRCQWRRALVAWRHWLILSLHADVFMIVVWYIEVLFCADTESPSCFIVKLLVADITISSRGQVVGDRYVDMYSILVTHGRRQVLFLRCKFSGHSDGFLQHRTVKLQLVWTHSRSASTSIYYTYIAICCCLKA